MYWSTLALSDSSFSSGNVPVKSPSAFFSRGWMAGTRIQVFLTQLASPAASLTQNSVFRFVELDIGQPKTSGQAGLSLESWPLTITNGRRSS